VAALYPASQVVSTTHDKGNLTHCYETQLTYRRHGFPDNPPINAQQFPTNIVPSAYGRVPVTDFYETVENAPTEGLPFSLAKGYFGKVPITTR
jgi:hypothetical protein